MKKSKVYYSISLGTIHSTYICATLNAYQNRDYNKPRNLLYSPSQLFLVPTTPETALVFFFS